MKKIFLALLMLPYFSDAGETIFDIMDEKTSVTTGVYKLSAEEKRELAKWFKHSEKDVIKKEKTKNMGLQVTKSDRQLIQTAIVGETSGWNGKTVFVLENGQKWKQIDGSRLYFPSTNNPAVTIQPKSFGSWILHVDGYNRGVKVKRIK